MENTKIFENHEGYKYLGIIESSNGKTQGENINIVVKSIEKRIELLCKTKLNAKNLSVAINEHALSLVNFYVGVLNVEPNIFKEIDEKIRNILVKHHVHHQPACTERLYLPRKELGRGFINIEFQTERMLLQLYNTLEKSRETCLRRGAILNIEKKNSTHMSYIGAFLKAKYKMQDPPSLDELSAIQKKILYSMISKNIITRSYIG